MPDYEYTKDLTKVKWLKDGDTFNRTSVWVMWWSLLHAIKEILIILRRLDNGRK